MGPKRIRGIREALAGRFRRATVPTSAESRASFLIPHQAEQPPVSELLDIDREYWEKAKVGRLPQIAPQRFIPTREASLPLLHTQRGSRHYTALYSNTARAHELGMTHDLPCFLGKIARKVIQTLGFLR